MSTPPAAGTPISPIDDIDYRITNDYNDYQLTKHYILVRIFVHCLRGTLFVLHSIIVNGRGRSEGQRYSSRATLGAAMGNRNINIACEYIGRQFHLYIGRKLCQVINCQHYMGTERPGRKGGRNFICLRSKDLRHNPRSEKRLFPG
jgi:hypothetical protein